MTLINCILMYVCRYEEVRFEVSQSICIRIFRGKERKGKERKGKERKGKERTISIGLLDYSPARGTEPAATIVMNGEDGDER